MDLEDVTPYLNDYLVFMNGISLLNMLLIAPWLLLLIFHSPSVWIRTSSPLHVEYGYKWKYGFISYGSSVQYNLRTQGEASSLFVCMEAKIVALALAPPQYYELMAYLCWKGAEALRPIIEGIKCMVVVYVFKSLSIFDSIKTIRMGGL